MEIQPEKEERTHSQIVARQRESILADAEIQPEKEDAHGIEEASPHRQSAGDHGHPKSGAPSRSSLSLQPPIPPAQPIVLTPRNFPSAATSLSRRALCGRATMPVH
jgi:hypothetical protein